jgi:uncharacterized protein YndB with AHSA1/START domain
MPAAEHTVTVERPIEDVFAFLVDGTNNPRWRSGVRHIERTSAEDGPGATYRQVLSGPGGRAVDGDYRIGAYEAPNLLAFDVTAGPARPSGRFELTALSPTSTRVRFALSLEPTGMMRLMGPMITREMRSQVTSLDRLKAVLEDPAQPGPD